ncbi:fam-l protein [Plasmodium brasilianum]|uniref:Fam-l protein n=1 Tax=Plasmodium brasilianum TaxID=5824 RepID=A0ACB9YDM7_PLABR|nr:fam-l protein [Plasmodium brasilianum]
MELKNKLLFFTKITLFIFLYWIYHFNYDVCMFNKSIDRYHSLCKNLDKRTYRLLKIYKQDENSNILEIKEDIPNNALIVDMSLSFSGGKGFLQFLVSNEDLESLSSYFKDYFDECRNRYLILFKLRVILILGVAFCHKKVKKFEKINFRKRKTI